jgi:ribonuclease BN (tRNA processing enzyme)
MKLEFLGTAGYHPSENRHTSCALISDAAPDSAFILDAGTGFFRLIGRTLPSHLHIFLSHAHLDHVFGLTFYLDLIHSSPSPLDITIYGAQECLDAVLSLFDSPLFPVAFRDGKLIAIEPGEVLDVAGVKVSAHPLTHPGGSLAYRFDWPEKSLAYVTDTGDDARYLDFIQGVDVLIHERNFSDDMHELARLSGHCTTEAVIRVAKAAQVGQLIMTHFNPLAEGDPMEEDALREACPEAQAADDGLVLEF